MNDSYLQTDVCELVGRTVGRQLRPVDDGGQVVAVSSYARVAGTEQARLEGLHTALRVAEARPPRGQRDGTRRVQQLLEAVEQWTADYKWTD